jgi:Protein of unknown function (DUF4038)/Putative collagen-binding domain of a collagenase
MPPLGRLLAIIASLFLTVGVAAAPTRTALPKLKVSADHRFIVRENGEPFFYLADTAWELLHRLDRKDAAEYLRIRAEQGFTVVQAVALAETDGLTDPNPYGKLPLIDKDPTRPAITPGANPSKGPEYDYWDHVDYIIDEANRNGLYVGLLPTWGRWVVKDPRKDESIFTVASAQTYGEFLGKRFSRKGVVWILGGDRKAAGVEDIWRAMAKGIAIGVAGKEDYDAVLMSFHPTGAATSSTSFHNDPWLDINMQQTGHGLAENTQPWAKIAADYALQPPKPVIDAEPLYEDHPLAFRSTQYGYSLDAHVRQRAYWDLFSGSIGHTYGNHAVWQMYTPNRKPVNGPLMYWTEAIHRPGANEMRYVRELIESRPVLSRVPDQTLVADELQGSDHISATRGDGYAFIYDAQGRPFTVRMGKISGDRVKCWWFNPRSGDASDAGEFENAGTRDFKAPSVGFGSDWVLILDDASKNYKPPVRTGKVVI